MDNRTDSDRLLAAASRYGKEKDYWLEKLTGHPEAAHFPYDKTGEIDQQDKRNMEKVTFEVSGSINQRLIKMSGGSDYRLHMILAAGIIVLLNKYSGNNDLLLGVPIHKQKVEGEFTNTVLVLRNNVTPGMSFKELLLQFRQTITGAGQNSNYPVETLLYQLGLKMTAHTFPLFEVAVLLENIHDRKY
ncbi:MAG: non-ribosomal peptide synthetase, partial [bacterium]|nr:non-ribosomal peptide synthetase [bacterium]